MWATLVLVGCRFNWHHKIECVQVSGRNGGQFNWKWRNNLIESDHAAMKRLLGYRQSFRSLRTAKATLSGLETIRTIKHGHIGFVAQSA
jgi:transposase-like protein